MTKFALVALTILLASCGSGSPPTDPNASRIASIVVTPSAVLFTGSNQSKTLKAAAFDANNQPVPVEATTWNWSVTDPTQVSLTTNPDGSATITSKTAVGSAFVGIRASSFIGDPAAITTAAIKPGVQIVTDETVIFPPASSRSTSNLGRASVGGFTGEELAAYLEAPANGNPRYPVVLRGPAPALEALMVSGEGAAVFGRVKQAQTRGEFSLVQLEMVPLSEAFTDLKLKASFDELRAKGVLAAQTRTRDVQLSPQALPPLSGSFDIGRCKATGGAFAGSLQIESQLTLQPFFDLDVNVSDSFFRLSSGVVAGINISPAMTLTPTAKITLECPLLPEDVKADIPLTGPFYKLLVPRLRSGLYLDATLQGQGAFGSLAASWAFSPKARVGFEVQYNKGTPSARAIAEDLSDPKLPGLQAPKVQLNAPVQGQGGPLQIYGSLFGYAKLDLGIQFLGFLYDAVDASGNILPQVVVDKLEELEQQFFLRLAAIKAGPKFGLAAGNREFAVQQRLPSYGAELRLAIEGALVPDQIERLAKLAFFQVLPFEVTAKWEPINFPLYQGFKPGLLKVNGTDVSQGVQSATQHTPLKLPPASNPTLTIEVSPEPGVTALDADALFDIGNIPDAFRSGFDVSLVIYNKNGNVYTDVPNVFKVEGLGLAPNSRKITIGTQKVCENIIGNDPAPIFVLYTNRLFNVGALPAPSLAGSFVLQCGDSTGGPGGVTASDLIGTVWRINFRTQYERADPPQWGGTYVEFQSGGVLLTDGGKGTWSLNGGSISMQYERDPNKYSYDGLLLEGSVVSSELMVDGKATDKLGYLITWCAYNISAAPPNAFRPPPLP